jgi:pimeloyl-ACP methyl ester carboxylesterase
MPESRGMGRSDLGEDPVTVAALAADVGLVMDAREIDAATVVGWSLGGIVAQEMAAADPARIASLVLLATAPGGDRATEPDPEVWDLLTDHGGSPREQASRLLSLLFPPAIAPGIDEQFGDVVAAARAQLSPAALEAQEAVWEAWRDGPYRDHLSGLTCPILVACGSEDAVMPPANSVTLAGESDHAWLARFQGVGHALMAQEPQRLATLIRLCAQAGAG